MSRKDRLTTEQKVFLLELLKKGMKYTDIMDEFKRKFNKEISKGTLTYLKKRYMLNPFKYNEFLRKYYKAISEKPKEEEEEEDEIEERKIKKERIKSEAKRTQTKPQTAVDRIINKEITEQATEIVADYILLGKELKERLEEKAKRYGFVDVASYVLFLDDFYEKNKLVAEEYERLKKKYDKLKSKYVMLKLKFNNSDKLYEHIKRKYLIEAQYLALIKNILES